MAGVVGAAQGLDGAQNQAQHQDGHHELLSCAPLVVLDEGPLILVETKRDLGQMSLPTDNDVTA